MLLPFAGLALLVLAFPLLVLFLLVVVLSLRRRVRALEARLDGLARERAAASSSPPVEAVALPVSTPAPPPAPQAPPSGRPEPPPVEAPPVVAPPPPLPRPTVVAAAHGGPGGLEGRLGGTWLNRAGALVLVLGVGFFLEYAFESEWIGPAGRVALGLAGGLALLLLGERLQRAAYRVPAQGLAAAGIGILFLSVYAAHGFYELASAGTAFVLMALVTVVGMAVALRHDARAVAFLAGLGGLLAPVLLGAGADRAGTLFTYLAILDVGLLVTGARRRWTELGLLSFAGTQVLYGGWFGDWYEPGRLPVALGGASLFFLLFALAGAAEAGGRSGRVSLLVLAAPTAYFLWARAILAPERTEELALLCLALATAYLVAARWALAGRPAPAHLHRGLALTFLTLAFAVHLSSHTLPIAWSVEGVVLVWGGRRLDLPRLRAGGLAVLALAWGRWLSVLTLDPGGPGTFLLAHPALPATVAVVVAAGLAAVHFRPRDGEDRRRWEALAYPLLVLAALSSVALLLTDELGRFRTLRVPPPYVRVLGTMVWTVTALPALALARRDRTRVLLGAATLLLIAVGLAAIFSDAPAWSRIPLRLRPVALNPRFLGGLLIVVMYGLYARIVPEFPTVSPRAGARLGALAGWATALVLLWDLSAEVVLAPLEGRPGGEAAKLRGAGLSILWTLYAFTAMGVGLWRGRAALRIGALALFTLTVAKVLLVDLSALDAVYRILSFMVLGATLLLASFVYARYRRRGAPGEPS